VTAADRSDLTARRLALRLEELACALERAGVPEGAAARLLESASVATMHAVSLDLVTSERAADIWDDATRRHPVLAAVGVERSARASIAA
jgi:hypothetical protein